MRVYNNSLYCNLKKIPNSRRCPLSVKVKTLNRSKRVRTPLALLRSLSDKYDWERYEPPYPHSYRFNNTTTVLLEGLVWH